MRYTVRDTPEVVERVERDLARIVEVLSEADPGLEAVVLTGGFARGEGALLDGKPQNDYDLVAVRGLGRPQSPYDGLRRKLEGELGLHVDLQPVWSGRLRWARPSIFWYETALRGRVLWGEADVLARVPVRSASDIDRAEGARLLANRAAGLLLARQSPDPVFRQIQASKALLASLDAYLLGVGDFPPSQLERWQRFEERIGKGSTPTRLLCRMDALTWAILRKTDPARAPEQDEALLWREAAEAVLEALPFALASAGFSSVEDFARWDHSLDAMAYRAHAQRVPAARRWATHPSGRLRAATLAMLAEELGAPVPHGVAGQGLRSLVKWLPETSADRIRLLEQLRDVTPQ